MALIVAAGALGTICGGAGTYAYLSATKQVVTSKTDVPMKKAPKRAGVAKPESKDLADGWKAYTFPDLDVSVELPGAAVVEPTEYPVDLVDLVSEDSYYKGHGASSGFRIGGYWTKEMRIEDPEAVVRYNLSREDYLPFKRQYSLETTTVEGNPACLCSGNYDQSGAQADYKSLCICHGNGVYTFELNYWDYKKADSEATWNRMIRSFHFLNRVPAMRR